ncbi:MAG: hypothetical protein CMM93_04325 [Rickettsiales bacterium]|nr:hypothetical protein [Rickettsiales bacterium]|tara:strand:- start:1080 stop:1430 length:351 start_codon:yes stop_codon:yes gene_type:complete
MNTHITDIVITQMNNRINDLKKQVAELQEKNAELIKINEEKSNQETIMLLGNEIANYQRVNEKTRRKLWNMQSELKGTRYGERDALLHLIRNTKTLMSARSRIIEQKMKELQELRD